MPRASWPLQFGRPSIEIRLETSRSRQQINRVLLADTGGGSDMARFELVLSEDDCQTYKTGRSIYDVQLGGAFSGMFKVFLVRVQMPQLSFDQRVRAVAVSTITTDFDGIACFRFLNRFGYGNFGVPTQFGLER